MLKDTQGGKLETKREKFKRLAEARTNKIIDMIRLLGNLSSKSTYDYSEDDILKIFNSIDREIKISRMKFSCADNTNTKFKL